MLGKVGLETTTPTWCIFIIRWSWHNWTPFGNTKSRMFGLNITTHHHISLTMQNHHVPHTFLLSTLLPNVALSFGRFLTICHCERDRRSSNRVVKRHLPFIQALMVYQLTYRWQGIPGALCNPHCWRTADIPDNWVSSTFLIRGSDELIVVATLVQGQ